MAAGRDDGRHTPRLDGRNERVVVVTRAPMTASAPSGVSASRASPWGGLMPLAACQHAVEKVAQTAGEGVDLGAEPAP